MQKNRCVTLPVFCFAALGWLIVNGLSNADASAKPKGADMRVDARAEVPHVIAVRFHHDMCPFCKGLKPIFAGLPEEFADESVLFVTLDMSSAASQRQAGRLVAALGIESLWTGDLSKIGTITFVDGTSRRVLSSVRTLDAKEIRVALRVATGAAQDGQTMLPSGR